MKRLAGIVLCVGLSLLIGGNAYAQKGGGGGGGGAGGGGRGGNTNRPTPAPTPGPQLMLVKYVASATQGNLLMIRFVDPITGGNIDMPADSSVYEGKQVPNAQVDATLKASVPGDFFKATVATAPGGRKVVRQLDRYNIKPGEDEPNVYIYQSIKEEKVNNRPAQFLMATKFEQEFKFQVPPGRDPVTSKPVGANPDMMTTIGSFKAGDSVEIVSIKPSQVAQIKTIKAYQPPKEATFTKVATIKLDDKDVPALQISLDGQDQTLPLLPTAAQSIRSKVGALKSGSSVLIKTETDAKGTTYISDLRPVPAKPAAKAG